MSGARCDDSAPMRSRPIDGIAQQSKDTSASLPTTVHSCNRLGRVANTPRAVLFTDWWRRRVNRGE